MSSISLNDLIGEFGGVPDFCAAVSTASRKLTRASVYKWRHEGRIAHSWTMPIYNAARLRGINVDSLSIQSLAEKERETA